MRNSRQARFSARIVTIGFSVALASVLFLPLSRTETKKQITYALLIDNTRSLEKQFPQVLAISRELVRVLKERGDVTIFSFTPKRDESRFVMLFGVDRYEGGNYDHAVATLGIDSTRDQEALLSYVDRISIVKGQTDLLGAIETIANFFESKPETGVVPQEKIVILLTDGDHRMAEPKTAALDTMAETDYARGKLEKDIVKLIKDRSINVFAVGLTSELDTSSLFRKSRRLSAEDFLTKLAKQTGGRVVFAGKAKNINAQNLCAKLLVP